jgi:hypothetical protein
VVYLFNVCFIVWLVSILCEIAIQRFCGPAPSITTEIHPRQLPLLPLSELVSQTQPYSPPLKGPLEEAEDDDDDEIHQQHGMSLFDKFAKEDNNNNNDCQREIQTTQEMEIV